MPILPTLVGPEAPPPAGKPECLIIMLHGVGLDGSDLFRFAADFQAVVPVAHIAAPHAPYRFDLGRSGRQWFSLQGVGPDTRLKGVRAVAPTVERFIQAKLAKTGVGEDRLILCGFSQGAMIALYVGLRRKTAPAAILAHSGMVVDEAELGSALRSRPPVLLTHGQADDTISPMQLDKAQAALQAASVPVEAHLLAGLGHEMTPHVVSVAQNFVVRILNMTLPPSLVRGS